MEFSIYYLTIVETLLYLFHLSVLVLLVLKRNTTFKGPFYSIFRIVMTSDFLIFFYMVLNQQVSKIPILIPFFKTNNWIASLMMSLFCYVIVIVYSGHLFMAFNRFTLIWLPLKYQQIWKKQWYTFMLIFLLPFLNVCWRLHEPAKFVYYNETTAKVIYLSEKITAAHFIVQSIVYLTTTFLAAIFNGLSLCRFWFYKNSALSIKDKHLLFVSLITFGFQLLRTGYAVQQVILPDNLSLTTFFLQTLPIFNDGFALSGSISLLILSKSSRKLYFSFYFEKFSNFFGFTKAPLISITKCINPTQNNSTVGKNAVSTVTFPRIQVT